MYVFSGRNTEPPDALFLERLDAFMVKCLADIKAFADREYRPFEETRQYVAEWHSRYLFQPPPPVGDSTVHLAAKVRSLLCDTSRILESLYETAGIQSFVLAVDLNNPDDKGFLGGSVMGREFWRGLRNGGESGAKTFREYCLREQDTTRMASAPHDDSSSSRSSSVPTRHPPAKSLKNELYENVRKALRLVSGIRNAEMKWTSPDKLNVYGVRLVGWPSTIPAQNPSTLRASQNQLLLDSLERGIMRFEKILVSSSSTEPTDRPGAAVEGLFDGQGGAEDVDFSWAYDADGGSSSVCSRLTMMLHILGSLSCLDYIATICARSSMEQRDKHV
ncbi:hypothetical protein BDZ94DRAFT_1154544 [Collybia nuda]|uniref:Uncharacterized protein n=1 Tax=Collybia nuda TaxID=64659 RepID=A0A9P6CIW3_9AGAR|nr:hypothetical protein BDZ94DRAFT_1154544 [Collybia nuda]